MSDDDRDPCQRLRQLPKLSMPALETLTRDEIDLMERSVDSERDKLIIRIFGEVAFASMS